MLKKVLSITLLCSSFYAHAMDHSTLFNMTHADLITKISACQNQVSPEALDYMCEVARQKREVDFATGCPELCAQDEAQPLIAKFEQYIQAHPTSHKLLQALIGK